MEGTKPPQPQRENGIYLPPEAHPFTPEPESQSIARRAIIKSAVATLFGKYILDKIPTPTVIQPILPDVGVPSEVISHSVTTTLSDATSDRTTHQPRDTSPVPQDTPDTPQPTVNQSPIDQDNSIGDSIFGFNPEEVIAENEKKLNGVGGTDSIDASSPIESEKPLSVQLVEIYGKDMDPRRYRTQADKEALMTEIIELAQEIDPTQPNLPRQIAAVINSGIIPGTVGTFENAKDFIEQYKEISKQLVNIDNLSDVYMAIIDPRAIGKGLDTVIRSEHPGHDLNQDGYVSKAEETVIVYNDALQKGENPKNLLTEAQTQEMEPVLRLFEQVVEIRRKTNGNEWKDGEDIRRLLTGANTDVIQSREKLERNGHPQERNPLGALLKTIDKAYASQFEEERKNIFSNADLTAFFSNHPDYFDEIALDMDDALKHLPVGSFIIFNPNIEGSDEFVYDHGEGRSVIVRPNRKEDNAAMNGSDRESLLTEDLSEMRNGYRVFVPIL